MSVKLSSIFQLHLDSNIIIMTLKTIFPHRNMTVTLCPKIYQGESPAAASSTCTALTRPITTSPLLVNVLYHQAEMLLIVYHILPSENQKPTHIKQRMTVSM